MNESSTLSIFKAFLSFSLGVGFNSAKTEQVNKRPKANHCVVNLTDCQTRRKPREVVLHVSGCISLDLLFEASFQNRPLQSKRKIVAFPRRMTLQFYHLALLVLSS